MLNKGKNRKSGVSLITLIITIVIMIIIASAVVYTLSGNGDSIVEKTSEVVIKSDIQSMLDKYIVVHNALITKYQGDESLITEEDFLENPQDTSSDNRVIFEKYKDTFKATRYGLEYIGNDENIKKIAEEMGVIVSK